MKSKKNYLTEDLSEMELPYQTDDYPMILLGNAINPIHVDTLIPSPRSDDPYASRLSQVSASLSSNKAEKKFRHVKVRGVYRRLLIRRSSTFYKIWSIVVEIVLTYNIITTLFFLAFEYPNGIFLICDTISKSVFILEIVLNFFTEQIGKNSRANKTFRVIARKYSRGWLLFDILAILPLRFARLEMGEYLLRMFRLFKLPKVLNFTDGYGLSYLLTYFKFGRREKNGKTVYSYKNKIVASLVKLLILVIFLVYFLGCFWFWFQKLVANYKYSQGSKGSDENIFENAYDLQNTDSLKLVLLSSYYILTTIFTIGYGDYTPKNVYEMTFIFILMLFGAALIGIIDGSFNNAISVYSDATCGFDIVGELHVWLGQIERVQGALDLKIRNKIIDHFQNFSDKDRLKLLSKKYWEAKCLDDLVNFDQVYVRQMPEEIYNGIIEILFTDFIHNFKYFLGSKMHLKIIPHLQPRKFSQDELIYTQGEEIDELIFLVSGRISIGVNFNENHQSLLVCEKGRTIIGDYAILTRQKNNYDYLSEVNSESFSINGEIFMKIVENYFPEDKISMIGLAVKRENTLKKLKKNLIATFETEGNSPLKNKKNISIIIPRENHEFAYNKDEIAKKITRFMNLGADMDLKSKIILSEIKSRDELRDIFIVGINDDDLTPIYLD